MSLRKTLLGASVFVSTAVLAVVWNAQAQTAPAPTGATAPASAALETALVDGLPTATPIKHLVIIYDENVSFDHYFATYPHAANPAGEPSFTRASHTPPVNNLSSANLLTNNPNFTNTGNGVNAAEPFRLDLTQAASADQNHNYTPEQQAEDGGKMDLFPEYTGTATAGGAGAFGTKGQVMGYYDGNTVTALWNYASHFAMSDNAYTDTFGPSTPGALEVVAGQTNGLQLVASSNSGYYINDGVGGLTLINDVDPGYDVCSSTTDQGIIHAANIGDLLNAAKVPWGGFMGGFNLSATNTNGTTGCARSTTSAITNVKKADYVAHHNWFQYFPSTANPTHARPAALTNIGYTFAANSSVDPANHEYDLTDFYSAVAAGDYPAVSYIKLPAYQDAHAGYSDPVDEQNGLVTLVNFLESQPDWKNTAIIVTYDDSDGWYDHAFATPTNPSFDATADQLGGAGVCGSGKPSHGVSYGNKPVAGPVNGRCGPGTRIPFLVISPWARQNFVDNFQITQASVVKFIENNWLGSKRLGGGAFDSGAGLITRLFDFKTGNTPALVLDPTTGEPTGS
jgi:phospholipase C